MFSNIDPEFTGFINLFIKWGLFVGLMVYLVFAAMIIRQIDLMRKSFETGNEAFLRQLALAHLGVVLLFMVVVVVML